MNRRLQRIKLANKIMAQYQTDCPWCPMLRPGEKPNKVEVQRPDSHGICLRCLEDMKKQIKERSGKK